MIACKYNLFHAGAKVMHIAPERWLVKYTEVVNTCNYSAYDLVTEKSEHFGVSVAPLDLCRDLPDFPSNDFDLIVHHHVLEHLPCELGPVFGEFRRMLKTGGTMAFSMPIRPSVDTAEDLDLTLAPEERVRRFGQHNHIRAFGSNDLVKILESGLGPGIRVDAGRAFSDEDLRRAAVPPRAAAGLTGHSTLLYLKP